MSKLRCIDEVLTIFAIITIQNVPCIEVVSLEVELQYCEELNQCRTADSKPQYSE